MQACLDFIEISKNLMKIVTHVPRIKGNLSTRSLKGKLFLKYGFSAELVGNILRIKRLTKGNN